MNNLRILSQRASKVRAVQRVHPHRYLELLLCCWRDLCTLFLSLSMMIRFRSNTFADHRCTLMLSAHRQQASLLLSIASRDAGVPGGRAAHVTRAEAIGQERRLKRDIITQPNHRTCLTSLYY